MAEFNDELRAYTGFTDNVIDGFNKQEKSDKLAAHVAWHVPGGAGVVGRDAFVEKVYGEYSGVATEVEAKEPVGQEDTTDTPDITKNQEDASVEPSTAEVSDTVK